MISSEAWEKQIQDKQYVRWPFDLVQLRIALENRFSIELLSTFCDVLQQLNSFLD
jgi:hypothetical protein